MMKIKHNGFALSIVLWIVAALMLGVTLLLSFAKENNIQTREISNKLDAQIMSEEILEIAKYYIMTAGNQYITLQNPSVVSEKYTFPKEMRVDDTIYNLDNNSTIQLMDTSGLLNIFNISANQLIATVALKNTERQLGLEMQDSYMDWVDKDNDVRLNGAENVAYEIKKHKVYRARNHNTMQDINELRLINGFDKLSQERWQKIVDLSCEGEGGSSNLMLFNYAQLMGPLNISSLRAKSLVRMRERDPIKFINELSKIDGYDAEYYSFGYTQELKITIVVKKGRAVAKLTAVISFKYSDAKAMTIMSMKIE